MNGQRLEEEFKKINGSTLPEISGHPGIKKIINECLSKKEGATYEAKSLIDGKELYFQTSVSRSHRRHRHDLLCRLSRTAPLQTDSGSD